MNNLKPNCAVCGNEFTQKKNLNAHLRKVHQIEPETSKPKQNFQCNLCDKKFSCQSSLTRHTRQTHDYSSTGPVRKIRLICPYEVCRNELHTYVELRQHLLEHHNIEVEYEDLTFHSFSDFEKWKEQVQERTLSLYTQDTAMKVLKSGARRMFFNCHRSYTYKSKGKNLRSMKSIGTNKIGKVCPSRLEMTLIEDNEEPNISVKFWKTHCGHTEQVERIVLNKNVRSKIAEKLEEGISFDGILDSICDSELSDGISQRLLLLNRKDMHNILRDFNIDYSAKCHKKDAVNTKMLLESGVSHADDSLVIEGQCAGSSSPRTVSWDTSMTFKFIQLCQKNLSLLNSQCDKREVFDNISKEMSFNGYPGLKSEELYCKFRNMRKFFFDTKTQFAQYQRIKKSVIWPYFQALCSLFEGIQSMYSEVESDSSTFCTRTMSKQEENRNIIGQKSDDRLSNKYNKKWWMNIENEMEYIRIFRVSESLFKALQGEINHLEKTDNSGPDEALLATLYFLGSSDSIEDIDVKFNIELNSQLEKQLERILLLSSIYVKWPNENEYDVIEKQFKCLYKIPDIIGVLGCAYFEVNVMDVLNDRKLEYFNENLQKSLIILQTVVDSNYLLRHLNVGFPGSLSIENVLKVSPLFELLSQKDSYLFKTGKHIIGGTEHPQMQTLLTPFEYPETPEQDTFNQLHSNVFNVIENTLCKMANRFKRIKFVDSFNPDLATLIICAICILHNFTVYKKDNMNMNFD